MGGKCLVCIKESLEFHSRSFDLGTLSLLGFPCFPLQIYRRRDSIPCIFLSHTCFLCYLEKQVEHCMALRCLLWFSVLSLLQLLAGDFPSSGNLDRTYS